MNTKNHLIQHILQSRATTTTPAATSTTTSTSPDITIKTRETERRQGNREKRVHYHIFSDIELDSIGKLCPFLALNRDIINLVVEAWVAYNPTRLIDQLDALPVDTVTKALFVRIAQAASFAWMTTDEATAFYYLHSSPSFQKGSEVHWQKLKKALLCRIMHLFIICYCQRSLQTRHKLKDSKTDGVSKTLHADLSSLTSSPQQGLKGLPKESIESRRKLLEALQDSQSKQSHLRGQVRTQLLQYFSSPSDSPAGGRATSPLKQLAARQLVRMNNQILEKKTAIYFQRWRRNLEALKVEVDVNRICRAMAAVRCYDLFRNYFILMRITRRWEMWKYHTHSEPSRGTSPK
eukprot:scaffold1828_cov187-Ochromonas_danica.AAC.9